MDEKDQTKKPNPILVNILIGVTVLYIILSALIQANLYTRVGELEHEIEHMHGTH